MGLLDKVTSQAKDLKEKVGEKVEDVQTKRKAADLLEELGRYSFAERTGRAVAGADPEVERIVGELQHLESDGVKVLPDH